MQCHIGIFAAGIKRIKKRIRHPGFVSGSRVLFEYSHTSVSDRVETFADDLTCVGDQKEGIRRVLLDKVS